MTGDWQRVDLTPPETLAISRMREALEVMRFFNVERVTERVADLLGTLETEDARDIAGIATLAN